MPKIGNWIKNNALQAVGFLAGGPAGAAARRFTGWRQQR